jgi:hypothetical protein
MECWVGVFDALIGFAPLSLSLSRKGRGDARIKTGLNRPFDATIQDDAYSALERIFPSPPAGEDQGAGYRIRERSKHLNSKLFRPLLNRDFATADLETRDTEIIPTDTLFRANPLTDVQADFLSLLDHFQQTYQVPEFGVFFKGAFPERVFQGIAAVPDHQFRSESLETIG